MRGIKPRLFQRTGFSFIFRAITQPVEKLHCFRTTFWEYQTFLSFASSKSSIDFCFALACSSCFSTCLVLPYQTILLLSSFATRQAIDSTWLVLPYHIVLRLSCSVLAALLFLPGPKLPAVHSQLSENSNEFETLQCCACWKMPQTVEMHPSECANVQCWRGFSAFLTLRAICRIPKGRQAVWQLSQGP